jgi:hypothetical protein
MPPKCVEPHVFCNVYNKKMLRSGLGGRPLLKTPMNNSQLTCDCLQTQTVYTDGTTSTHGTRTFDATPTTVYLFPNETVTGMWGNYGWYYAFVSLTTSLGRVLGPYGGPNGGGPFTFTGSVFGFFGSEALFGQTSCLAGLGAYITPKGPPPQLPSLTPVTAWLGFGQPNPYTSWDDGPHPGKALLCCRVQTNCSFLAIIEFLRRMHNFANPQKCTRNFQPIR